MDDVLTRKKKAGEKMKIRKAMEDEHADAWMVQALFPGVIGTVSGKIRCADALHRPEHWRE